MRRWRTVLTRGISALASAVMLVVACANGVESRGEPNVGGPVDVAAGLDVPWGIAFLPDGSALIAERNSGAIKHMTAPGVINPAGSIAGVAASGEGGLLGLAAAGPTVFAYVTTGQDNRVVRMRFDGGTLGEQSPILTGIPADAVLATDHLQDLYDGQSVKLVGTASTGA